jgi:hypothetical protein
MPERQCPAYNICDGLGTARASCQDLFHHCNLYDKGEPTVIKSLGEINSRLTEIQACLSSLVVSLNQDK